MTFLNTLLMKMKISKGKKKKKKKKILISKGVAESSLPLKNL